MTTYRRPLFGVIAAGFGAAAVLGLASGPALADEMPTHHHHMMGHHHHEGRHHEGRHHEGHEHEGWGHWGCPRGPIKDGGHCRHHEHKFEHEHGHEHKRGDEHEHELPSTR
ncbi:hypothetical protein [Actinomadura harenae]|uniref:hypothetical protein n=1 Tax=Actinomadura harenae TaxID=2483351 RepID=UPI00131542FB|nr:hypothetical protein [Actinomadura harenae]